MTSTQISTVAAWRRREESLGLATARAEAGRLAKRIVVLEDELADNRDQLVTVQAPELLDLRGVGAITAAVI